MDLNSYRLKRLIGDVSLRLLILILVIFFLGDLLGYFVGQLTHNAAMENQDALNKMFIHVPTYLQFAVVGFIIPIMEEIIFRGLLSKVLFGKYFKMGLVISSLLDRKSTRLNSSHRSLSRMPSSA